MMGGNGWGRPRSYAAATDPGGGVGRGWRGGGGARDGLGKGWGGQQKLCPFIVCGLRAIATLAGTTYLPMCLLTSKLIPLPRGDDVSGQGAF